MLCLARSTRVAPATTSGTMVREVIRRYIGFDGLLMSDDVSMNALSGTLAERSRAALARRLRHGAALQRQARRDARGRAARRRRSPAMRRGAPTRRSRRGASPAPFDVAAAREEFAALMCERA